MSNCLLCSQNLKNQIKFSEIFIFCRKNQVSAQIVQHLLKQYRKNIVRIAIKMELSNVARIVSIG